MNQATVRTTLPPTVLTFSVICALALVAGIRIVHASNPPAPANAATADYPDHVLTPGVSRSSDLQTILNTEAATEQGRPNTAIKQRVFEEYGIQWSDRSNYEVDHYISIDIGGSNDIRNLWPEHLEGRFGAKVKDRLEDKLGKMIRDGELTPADAQRAISNDWEAAYVKYVGPL